MKPVQEARVGAQLAEQLGIKGGLRLAVLENVSPVISVDQILSPPVPTFRATGTIAPAGFNGIYYLDVGAGRVANVKRLQITRTVTGASLEVRVNTVAAGSGVTVAGTAATGISLSERGDPITGSSFLGRFINSLTPPAGTVIARPTISTVNELVEVPMGDGLLIGEGTAGGGDRRALVVENLGTGTMTLNVILEIQSA